MSEIPTYEARTLLHWTTAELQGLPDQWSKVIYDDGTLVIPIRSVIASHFFWEFHRRYPDTPLLKRHQLDYEYISKSYIREILENCHFDCFNAHQGRISHEVLGKITFESNNRLYNFIVTELQPYVSTLSIYDFVDVVENEKVKEANDFIKENIPTPDNIDKSHQMIEDTLLTRGVLVGNPLARTVKSGLVKTDSLIQVIGVRGAVTDYDKTIFPNPITSSYMEGLYKLHDVATESRSATKAQIANTVNVADSETFNRELQLVSSVLTRIHKVDCGSQKYLEWRIDSKDLKFLTGKYYLDPETGGLKTIGVSSTELIGKTIQIRSTIKCQHSDPYGACATCVGEMANSFVEYTNVGHVSATAICEVMSQRVLSTKHFEASSRVEEFKGFDEEHLKYLKIGSSESNTIMLNSRLKGSKILLSVSVEQAPHLASVHHTDVDNLTLANVSKITEVGLTVTNQKGEKFHPIINVQSQSGTPSLSREVLRHIQKHGHRIDPSNSHMYLIDLTDYDFGYPILKLPMRHPNIVEFMETVKNFYMSNKKDNQRNTKARKNLRAFPTVDQSLREFYELISSKLNTNIVHIENVVTAALIRGELDVDHRPPAPKDQGQISSYNKNMYNRSLSHLLAYKFQRPKLIDHATFMVKNRPDGPLDNLFCPYERINPRE